MVTISDFEREGFCIVKETVDEETVDYRLEDEKGNVIILSITFFPPDDLETHFYVIEGELPPSIKEKELRRSYNKNLREKVIDIIKNDKEDNESLELLAIASEIWPHSYCPHCTDIEKCGMCINGCDFF